MVTQMEHHANIVPWHMLAGRTRHRASRVPLTDDGQLDLTDLDETLDGAKRSRSPRVNVLGTIIRASSLRRRA